MPRDRQRLKLADYVVLAINPALIVVLVGSLVFFLLEILYAGNYTERMRYVLFWGVCGIVGVSRIALGGESSERAGLYGLVLGLAVYAAMASFVEYPEGAARNWTWLINIFLLAVVWWTSYCLTKDCTHLEDDAEIGNEGVLAAAGMGATGAAENSASPKAAEPSNNSRQGWVERYQRYRESQNKKRTPGVWVVYYSLAALPLFGLGQSLIPVEQEERRRYTFLLLCVYVASGLGLLLTTAFLGLRRYLRQRGARMPAVMTGAWLTTGLGLIVAFIIVGAVVPRPVAEYSLMPKAPAGSKARSANRQSLMHDSAGKDRGGSGGDSEKNDGKDAQQTGDGKGDKSGGSAKGADKSGGDNKAKDGQGKDSQGKDGKKGDGDGKDRQDEEQRGKSPNSSDRDGGEKQGSGGQGNEKGSGSGKKSSQSSSSSPKSPSLNLGSLQGLATFLKWVVFGLAVLAVLAVAFYKGLHYLAHFTAWAQRLLAAWHDFWARLFGGRGDAGERDDAGAKERGPAPFAVFADPFTNGQAERLKPRQLIQYSFQALESWAAERKLPRADGETPLEFAGRVGEEAPIIEKEIRSLGGLFTVAAYGPGSLPEDCMKRLQTFWEALAMANERSSLVSGARS